MNLVLDFGNTQKKIALFADKSLVLVQSHSHISKQVIKEFTENHPAINSCILSSVIKHPSDINNFLQKKFNFIELNEHTPIPITNKYETKSSLGNDRLAAAVAGSAKFPGENVLIINAGTALTCDFVNDRGDYLGGSISPGMRMRFTALHTFTDKLPLMSYQETARLIGTNTGKSIVSGVINGMVAEIVGICRCYREKYRGLKIILSGGDLDYFDKRLKISIFAFPNIVVHGLQQILSFNVHNSK